jgi:hypothetical protein
MRQRRALGRQPGVPGSGPAGQVIDVQAPAKIVGDPVGDVGAAVSAGRREPGAGVLVGLAAVGAGSDGDQVARVAEVVGVGTACSWLPVGAITAELPRARLPPVPTR